MARTNTKRLVLEADQLATATDDRWTAEPVAPQQERGAKSLILGPQGEAGKPVPHAGKGPLLLTDPVQAVVQEQLATDPAQAWIVSDWPATQTSRIRWSPDNVVFDGNGGFDLILSPAPEGDYRPYCSGEVATAATASEGTWEWDVQLPDMVSGTIFGMFLFQADASQPRLEFDIEFVGDDTTQLELNIHMQDDAGRMHRLTGGPVTIDLPFDAAEGVHSYTITVSENEVVFLVDGTEIGRFGPDDMPEGVWRTGEMRAYTDLWAVSPGGPEYWAGTFAYPGEPLVARVVDMDGPTGAIPPLPDGTIRGTAGDDDLFGTDESEAIDGLDGSDIVYAGGGDDTIRGGAGDDRIALDAGRDRIDGGAGSDWLIVTARGGSAINLALATPQKTGLGFDTVTGIENILGGRGRDLLVGNGGANILDGGAGDDLLRGGAGADRLTGGTGGDRLEGGAGADTFVFRSAAESGLRRSDTITDFATGDRIDLSAVATQSLNFTGKSAAAFGVWSADGRGATRLLADTDGDARADLQVTLWEGFTLDASHLIL